MPPAHRLSRTPRHAGLVGTRPHARRQELPAAGVRAVEHHARALLVQPREGQPRDGARRASVPQLVGTRGRGVEISCPLLTKSPPRLYSFSPRVGRGVAREP
nr:MAG TPA: hypothetical protein [Caudoviricetes sp.]